METEKANSSWMIPGKPAIEFYEEEFGKTLVITDLHLGFVYGQNKKGILIPVSKRPEEELVELIEERKPKRLIIVGDFKDEIFGTAHPLAGRAWKLLRRMLNLTRVTIIKGNHDGKIEEILPDEIELIQPSGLVVKEKKEGLSVGLWHGHANPVLDVYSADVTISGHAHPTFAFRDEIGTKITEKIWVKAKWLHAEGDQERLHIILPAFNKYLDGFSIDGKFFKTIVTMKEGIDFDNAEVFTLDGVLIGTIKELQDERIISDNERTKKRYKKR
ncbi:MAG: metallophosphoesterase family protein [Candidatus Heimdallarchaeota archaeon]